MPLKRNGELCKHAVPGFVGKLTPSELDTYNAAFEIVKDEFAALERIKNDVKELTMNPGVFTNPDSQFVHEPVETRHAEIGGLAFRWDVRSRLLKLNHSEVLLCERPTNEGKQFAVIEHFKNDSPYACANGNTAVILTSNDAAVAIEDYAANAQHTLRFMASNIVGMAQKVVWERIASQNPARVIRAISDRCAQAVGDAQDEIQSQILGRKISQRQSIGQSV